MTWARQSIELNGNHGIGHRMPTEKQTKKINISLHNNTVENVSLRLLSCVQNDFSVHWPIRYIRSMDCAVHLHSTYTRLNYRNELKKKILYGRIIRIWENIDRKCCAGEHNQPTNIFTAITYCVVTFSFVSCVWTVLCVSLCALCIVNSMPQKIQST